MQQLKVLGTNLGFAVVEFAWAWVCVVVWRGLSPYPWRFPMEIVGQQSPHVVVQLLGQFRLQDGTAFYLSAQGIERA